MNLTLTVNDEVLQRAQKHAETLGTSVDQLLCAYLDELATATSRTETDTEANALEFTQLSYLAHGHSKGWKFNREEAHERGRHARREDRGSAT